MQMGRCFIIAERCSILCNIPQYLDPWVLYSKIDPLRVPDIRGQFNLNIDKSGMVPFPVNYAVLGLQFYVPIKGALDRQLFYLEKDLELDPNFAKENGLRSNIIPAGKYPVLFNQKTGNYNAIVSVK